MTTSRFALASWTFAVLRALKNQIVKLLFLIVVCSINSQAGATFSFDWNSDGNVDAFDFIEWGSNQFLTGPGIPGDANGDDYVGALGDLNVFLCQWSPGATGSTATASATYDSSLGTGTVTVTPSSGGLGAVYLVDNLGNLTTGAPLGATAISETLPGPVSPPGFPAAANSVTFFHGTTDLLGSVAPMSTTFAVTPGTPVTDLQFFSQLTAQDLVPMSIFDSFTSTTHVPTVPAGLCSCVPEPASGMIFFSCLAMCGLLRRRIPGQLAR